MDRRVFIFIKFGVLEHWRVGATVNGRMFFLQHSQPAFVVEAALAETVIPSLKYAMMVGLKNMGNLAFTILNVIIPKS